MLKKSLCEEKFKTLIVDLMFASIYLPVLKSECNVMLNFIKNKLCRRSVNNHVIMGQDSNDKLGMSFPVDINERLDCD